VAMTCLDDESFFEDLLKKSRSSNDSYELNRSDAVAVAASAVCLQQQSVQP
jgi:hypothetical protein